MKTSMLMLAAILAAGSAPALAEKPANDKASTSIEAARAAGSSVQEVAARLRDYQQQQNAAPKITAEQARKISETIKISAPQQPIEAGRLNMLLDRSAPVADQRAKRQYQQAYRTTMAEIDEYEAFGNRKWDALELLPPGMILSKAEAEAAGWPCSREYTNAVEKTMFEEATRKSMTPEQTAYRRTIKDAELLKLHDHAHAAKHHSQSAAADCDDCPDCADGTCTEASHQAKKDFDCVDCPDHANV